MTLLKAVLLSSLVTGGVSALAQDQLTPLQRQIEQQRQRLSSSETEARRDALMKLGALHHPAAARAATAGLGDAEPIVRVAAVHAIAALPANEAVNLLLPLTKEKLEFVRREAVSALGETHSRSAVGPLLELLSADKEASVRAAAAFALGKIRDESAVSALIQILSGQNRKKREDEFVIRAAAEALGEIGSRAGAGALIATLDNNANPADLRRASAKSLGLIGDQSAKPALQAAFASDDPYLSEAAREALRRLRRSQN